MSNLSNDEQKLTAAIMIEEVVKLRKILCYLEEENSRLRPDSVGISKGRKSMELADLGDDVLAEVFAWLPPEALLGAVPLVSKRWRRVSRLPLSWRRAELVYPKDHNQVARQYFHRVVRCAPALGHLDLSRDCLPEDQQQVGEAGRHVLHLMSSLQEGVSVVRRVTFSHALFRGDPDDGMVREAFLGVLRRYAPHLRCLHFARGLCSCTGGNFPEHSVAGDESLFGVVASMPLLKDLRLQDQRLKFEDYDGELMRSAAALTTLALDWWDWDSMGKRKSGPAHPIPLLLDLLLSNCGSLERVRLRHSTDDLPRRVKEALSKCHNLRSLSLPWKSASLLSQFPRLRKLELHPSSQMMSKEEGFQLMRALTSSPCFPNLVHLAVSCPGKLPESAEGAACLVLLTAVKTHCSRLRSLALLGEFKVTMIAEVIGDVLSSLPNLQEFSLGSYVPEMSEYLLPKVQDCRGLKSLSIQRACWTDPVATKRFEAALETLKELRPDMKTTVSVSSAPLFL